MLARVFTLSAVASIATAQIATNADVNACLVPSPLITVLANSNASIVEPVNNWLNGLCAAPVCSNDTISAIVVNATAGCSAELATFGISSNDNSALTALVQQYYPTARKALCLKDGNTNCITQTLTNVQDIRGTLSISNIVSFASNEGSDTTLPVNVTCTDCVKAIYTTLRSDIPRFQHSDSEKDTCGATFVDGTIPSGITQSASDSTQTTTSNQGNGGEHLSSLSALSGASLIAFLALLA
ncbi:hypothetical protein H0H87_011880 [Tephrocybe sp. NHM501043]|nr:hypothetical protein H0H87_011880 [Tephrocybe sp. NHM501043]